MIFSLTASGISSSIYFNDLFIEFFTSDKDKPSDSAISLFESSFGNPMPNFLLIILLSNSESPDNALSITFLKYSFLSSLTILSSSIINSSCVISSKMLSL